MKHGEPKFKPGDRVILSKVEPCEDFPDGLPEERGVVDGLDCECDPAGGEGNHCGQPEALYVVTVDEKYRDTDARYGGRDDGVRGGCNEGNMQPEA